jgi:hypothetical protein
MDVNTRGGTFGPGGYGGGIFSGPMNGLGGLGAYARPMREHTTHPVQGLGASTIPGTCWGQTGFQDCFARSWSTARGQCDPAYGGNPEGFSDVPACIEYMADAHAFNDCVPKLCPQVKPKGTVTVGPIYVSGDPCSSPNTISHVQWVINTAVDGKWGTNSAKALVSSGKTYRQIVPGCTGVAPGDKPITGDADTPRVIGSTCPAGTMLDPHTGQCLPTTQPGKKAGISTAWVIGGLAAAAAVTAGVMVFSKKKKH